MAGSRGSARKDRGFASARIPYTRRTVPHSVQCPSCQKKIKISDQIWDRRVRGKQTALKCKSCQGRIDIDGREPRDDEPKPAADPPKRKPSVKIMGVEVDSDTAPAPSATPVVPNPTEHLQRIPTTRIETGKIQSEVTRQFHDKATMRLKAVRVPVEAFRDGPGGSVPPPADVVPGSDDDD